MQLSIFSAALPAAVLAAVAWCRPAVGCSGAFVVALRPGQSAGSWLLAQGCLPVGSQPIRSGVVAFCLRVPPALVPAFAALPAPVAHGSRTAGCELPW